MSNVLGELDDRLAKLEKSLVPIYKETGKLTRVSKSEFESLLSQLLSMTDDLTRSYRS